MYSEEGNQFIPQPTLLSISSRDSKSLAVGLLVADIVVVSSLLEDSPVIYQKEVS